MKKLSLLVAGLLVVLVAPSAAAAQVAQDPWMPSALSEDDGELPDAREVVQRMVDLLKSTTELSLEARVTYEAVQESGQNLQFDMLQRIAIRKPD